MDELEGQEGTAAEEEAPEIEEVPNNEEAETVGGEDGSEGEEEQEEDLPEIEDEIEQEINSGIEKDLKVGNVNFSDLKKEFPDLIKKYPGIRDVIFRDQTMQRIVGTVEEAKEVADKAEVYDFLDNSIVQGNLDPVINALNDNALAKFATNVLPAIARKDQGLFVKAVSPFVLNVCRQMASQEKRGTQEGKNIAAAARVFYNFLFDKGYDIPEKDAPEESPQTKQERENLQKQREQIFTEKAEEFRGYRDEITYRRLSHMVSSKLDPTNRMHTGQRTAIVKQIIDDIGEKLAGDKNHMATMNSLMRRAAKAGFSRSFVSQQVNAYLGRARYLVGTSVQKYRPGKNTDGKVVTGKPVNSGAPSGNGKGTVDPKKIDWRKTSTEDLFNDKVTYRK